MKNVIRKILILLVFICLIASEASAAAKITKPKKDDPTASVNQSGKVTYYTYDSQEWKKYSKSVASVVSSNLSITTSTELNEYLLVVK